jgi:hypothetical protein
MLNNPGSVAPHKAHVDVEHNESHKSHAIIAHMHENCRTKHCVHCSGAPHHLAMCGICMCSRSNAYGLAISSQYFLQNLVAVKMWILRLLDPNDHFGSGKHRALNVSKTELLPAFQEMCLLLLILILLVICLQSAMRAGRSSRAIEGLQWAQERANQSHCTLLSFRVMLFGHDRRKQSQQA